jgi:hypothetical protein
MFHSDFSWNKIWNKTKQILSMINQFILHVYGNKIVFKFFSYFISKKIEIRINNKIVAGKN